VKLNTPGLAGIRAVVVAPGGEHVYTASYGGDDVGIFRHDPLTGLLSCVGAAENGVNGVGGIDGVRSLTLSPDGKHLYTASYYSSAVAVFRRESSTGELSFVEYIN
jgi:6-phosphogluconolactonase (cycloisomerase 2 family)